MIDLDQKAILGIVFTGDYDDDTLHDLSRIYTDGGNSRPIAIVSLDEGLPVRLEAETPVQGFDLEGNEVEATLAFAANAGATQLRIAYKANSSHEHPGRCRVGLLPPQLQEVDSCLDTEGTLLINDTEYSYSDHYPEEDTVSGRTLQSFSVRTDYHRQDMDPESPYHDQMDLFASYYGVPDYADRIIMSAILDDVAGLELGTVETQNQPIETKASKCISLCQLLQTLTIDSRFLFQTLSPLDLFC